jgi:addiction module HigA family antidote
MTAPKNGMRPIHPGEILQEEFLKPLDMSANALAQAIGVPANRSSAIIAGERSITADAALRLARALDERTTEALFVPFGVENEAVLRQVVEHFERVAALIAALGGDSAEAPP